ncbi:MAG: N-acetyl-alpha-D-glucosaminyl L-malate synthase BshA [Longimicrobiales bacterium]|nr:N-acetyl-alpha-D-glucosaminyl L-malate synthase BshA [Longimicrobiales bacterium]
MGESLKIGITCYPVYGGSGVVATELGMELANRGHEVHFITYAQPFRLSRFVENIYYHEVEVPIYPLFEYPPYSLALAVEMQNTAERRHLDLLHVHYAIPHATSAWLAKELMQGVGPRVVTTLHGTDITLVGRDPSYQSVVRFSLLKSDGITAVSEFLKRETVERFDVPDDSIEVIPNFVDLEIYRRDIEPCHRDQFATDAEKVVMHISNFRSVKRVTDVVRIFARIARETPAKLVFIGDGPERGHTRKVAADEGVDARVVYLGKQESVADILACADLFLLPSDNEAFGLVALEAMACGVPVVGSDVGGLPEVVTGEAGRLHPVGDVDAMAASGLEILEGDRWEEHSRAARERATAFAAKVVVPRYEAYYRRILGR